MRQKVKEDKKLLSLPGIEHRMAQPEVQSLYWLSYMGYTKTAYSFSDKQTIVFPPDSLLHFLSLHQLQKYFLHLL